MLWLWNRLVFITTWVFMPVGMVRCCMSLFVQILQQGSKREEWACCLCHCCIGMYSWNLHNSGCIISLAFIEIHSPNVSSDLGDLYLSICPRNFRYLNITHSGPSLPRTPFAVVIRVQEFGSLNLERNGWWRGGGKSRWRGLLIFCSSYSDANLMLL